MASERDKKQRLEDNKNVKDGTIRKGKGGKGLRRWNKSSGRWEKVAVKGASKTYRSISKRGKTEDAKERESKRAKNPNLGLGGKNKKYVSPSPRKPASRFGQGGGGLVGSGKGNKGIDPNLGLGANSFNFKGRRRYKMPKFRMK